MGVVLVAIAPTAALSFGAASERRRRPAMIERRLAGDCALAAAFAAAARGSVVVPRRREARREPNTGCFGGVWVLVVALSWEDWEQPASRLRRYRG